MGNIMQQGCGRMSVRRFNPVKTGLESFLWLRTCCFATRATIGREIWKEKESRVGLRSSFVSLLTTSRPEKHYYHSTITQELLSRPTSYIRITWNARTYPTRKEKMRQSLRSLVGILVTVFALTGDAFRPTGNHRTCGQAFRKRHNAGSVKLAMTSSGSTGVNRKKPKRLDENVNGVLYVNEKVNCLKQVHVK